VINQCCINTPSNTARCVKGGTPGSASCDSQPAGSWSKVWPTEAALLSSSRRQGCHQCMHCGIPP
jgi:hypothetical protein